MSEYRPTLECQTCGEVLRYLSYAEAQRVADNPQNFIIDCKDCLS
jgi:hypothetical protein